MEQTPYLVEGRALHPSSPEFADAIAHAHSGRLRPKCLCQTDGIDMYVARLGDTYVVKRMPDSGVPPLTTIKTLASDDFCFQPTLDRSRVLALAERPLTQTSGRSASDGHVPFR